MAWLHCERDADKLSELRAKFAVVASALGYKLVEKEADGGMYRHFYLRKDDGRTICLHYDEWKKRIEVSGSDWPTSLGYNDSAPSIGVSASREGDAIARDIERRFLPSFNELWDKLKEKAEQEKQDKAGQEKTLAALAELTGGKVSGESVRLRNRVIDRLDVNYNGTTVTIKMGYCNTPVEKAVKIVKAIMGVEGE